MRILHFSDLHLRQAQEGTADKPERLSRKVPDLLQRLALAMPSLCPDVIVITGDLLDVPKPLLRGEVATGAMRDAMIASAAADYAFLRRWLERWSCPYLVLPGNHDLLEPFQNAFGNQPVDITIQGVRFLSFHDWEQADNVPHRLNAQRLLFDRCLSDQESTPQIHLQHYLLRPHVQDDYPYNYADSEAMIESVERDGRVIGVLAGHYHKGALTDHSSGVCYSVVPAFCIVPHPYRILDVTEKGQISIKEEALESAPASDAEHTA
jgi:3',5'-cyclic AMP phosphodiesterase CpdA